ncbi:hypothetical protein BDV19DRAFT_354447 [Aspergillus venezuelensis]
MSYWFRKEILACLTLLAGSCGGLEYGGERRAECPARAYGNGTACSGYGWALWGYLFMMHDS